MFLYFRVGVLGGPRAAGVVVEPVARPEVGAAYQKSAEALFSAVEGVAGDGREYDERVAGSKKGRLRESWALWDDAFGNDGRKRENRISASRRRAVEKRSVHSGFISSLGGP